MTRVCSHAGAITDVAPPLEVCEPCTAIGGTWVHLRQCLTCGRTMCCDDSPNQHTTNHHRETHHPVVRSGEPAESWRWCYPDQSMVRETPAGWERYDPFLEAGALVARQHAEAGGSFDLAPDHVTPGGFPLGEWTAYVRDARDDGALEPDEAALVEAVPGWSW